MGNALQFGASSDDRRRAPRVPFTSKSLVQGRHSDYVCRAVNLSATGMLLLAPEGPAGAPRGEPLRVNFFSAMRNEWIGVEATMTRETQVGGRPAWGLAFRRVNSKVAAMLRGLVNQTRPLGSSH
jgi:hypothetical protein